MKAHTSHEVAPVAPEEKRRVTSFHTILIECSAECEMIANIINTSRLQFLSLLDIVSNANHDESINSQQPDRSKRSVFGHLFHWLFSRLGGTDLNLEQLKSNVDILMANQNIQQG